MTKVTDSGTQHGDRPASHRRAQNLYGGSRYIDQLVEGWNHWSRVSTRTDRDNYVDGYVEFLFDYGGSCVLATHSSVRRREVPGECSLGVHGTDVHRAGRNIRDLFPEVGRRDLVVISRWNQKPVFVDVAQLVDQAEELVPTCFVVGPQAIKCAHKSARHFVGHSLLNSSLSVFLLSDERELNGAPLLFGDEGADDLPVRMIEGASEVEDRLADDNGGCVYDGFVLFGADGGLAGLYVALKSECERSMFAKKFAKLRDVFRGPFNLEVSAVHHG